MYGIFLEILSPLALRASCERAGPGGAAAAVAALPLGLARAITKQLQQYSCTHSTRTPNKIHTRTCCFRTSALTGAAVVRYRPGRPGNARPQYVCTPGEGTR
eukprot:3817880-Prymnesium_polylepis.1